MALTADWRELRVREPSRDEVAAAAGQLASYYNDPHNRAMLAHEDDLDADDVREHYDDLWREGGRPLWLEKDGALIGDADLRHVSGGVCEVAILIGDRGAQGQGLGTRFGVLVHLLAFRGLGLARTYATIIPSNPASLKLFARLGYERDDSPAAREYIDEEDDLTLSLDRDRFFALHAAALAEIPVKKKETISPLVDAAAAFDAELREYAKLARTFLDSSLGTARQLERVEETLGLIAACEERLTVTGQGLANAVSAARDEQEKTAQAMLDHLPVVRARTELLKALFAQFQALGVEAGALNQDTSRGGGPSALRDLAVRVLSLAERAAAVAAQAREADFGDLASQAHALAQQLAAAHKKLAVATL